MILCSSKDIDFKIPIMKRIYRPKRGINIQHPDKIAELNLNSIQR